MTTPSYDDLKDVPVGSDTDLTERLAATLGRALNRQVWLMFLDADDCQLPVLMPTDVPTLPGDGDAERIGGFLKTLGDDLEAATVVVAYERPGVATINDQDRVWLRLPPGGVPGIRYEVPRPVPVPQPGRRSGAP